MNEQLNNDKPLYIGKTLEIVSNEQFFYYVTFYYTQLKSLKIKNVSIHFLDFFNFLDNFHIEELEVMECSIACDLVSVLLTKHNSIIKLELFNVNNSVIHILNNLPSYINTLIVNCHEISDGDFYLDQSMTNLPLGLQELTIKLPDLSKSINLCSTIQHYEQYGYFNVLFGIKCPYSCIIIIEVLNKKYHVSYEDNDNTKITITDNHIEKLIITKVIPYLETQLEYVYLDMNDRRRFAAQ